MVFSAIRSAHRQDPADRRLLPPTLNMFVNTVSSLCCFSAADPVAILIEPALGGFSRCLAHQLLGTQLFIDDALFFDLLLECLKTFELG